MQSPRREPTPPKTAKASTSRIKKRKAEEVKGAKDAKKKNDNIQNPMEEEEQHQETPTRPPISAEDVPALPSPSNRLNLETVFRELEEIAASLHRLPLIGEREEQTTYSPTVPPLSPTILPLVRTESMEELYDL